MKYISFKSKVLQDLTESNLLSLFVNLYSGQYDDMDKEKLPSVLGMAKGTFEKSWKKLSRLGYIQETKDGFRITDEPDPLINHTNSTLTLFTENHDLLIWLNKHCPRVQRMKQPITNKEAIQLWDEFGIDNDLYEVFESMENNAQLHNKYVSANKTVRNWIKRRDQKTSTNGWDD